jgi:hypothetical protein
VPSSTVAQMISSDDEAIATNKNAQHPRFRLRLSSCELIAPLRWKTEDAQQVLAKTLGSIAADVWLAGRISLD